MCPQHRHMIEMLNRQTSDSGYNWERFVNLTGFPRLVNRVYTSRLLLLLILSAPVSCYLMTDCVKASPASEIIWSYVDNPSDNDDEASGVAVDSTGVYIVGYYCSTLSASDFIWRIEKRNLTDGSIIWTQTSNPSAEFDGAYAVAVDSSGLYVIGSDSSPGNDQWRIEKRSLATGALIPTFGAGGVVTNDLSDGSDSAFGVAVDSTGIYVVGRDYLPGNPAFRTERRSLTDGSLTWEETSNPSSGDDYANEISVDASGIYIVGSDSSLGNDEWRIEKRDPSRPASRLALTVYPSSVMAGSWTSKYTVQRQDYYGNPVTSGSTLAYLTTTSAGVGRKFAETSGGAPITSVTIPDGSSTRDFFYYDDMAGSCTVAVTSSDLAGEGKPLTITSRSGCVIATAAYGSEMTREVSYMRHVRDETIGSNQAGRYLVNEWNRFYYSWSPPIAELIAGSRELQDTFRILLLPVIAVVHSTAFVYDVTMPINTEFASVAAFLFAGVSSIAIYILTPLFICRSICRKRSKSRLNPQ